MRLRPCVMARPSLRPKEGRWFFPELIELFFLPFPLLSLLDPISIVIAREKGRKTSAVWGEEEKIASCSKLFLEPIPPIPPPYQIIGVICQPSKNPKEEFSETPKSHPRHLTAFPTCKTVQFIPRFAETFVLHTQEWRTPDLPVTPRPPQRPRLSGTPVSAAASTARLLAGRTPVGRTSTCSSSGATGVAGVGNSPGNVSMISFKVISVPTK